MSREVPLLWEALAPAPEPVLAWAKEAVPVPPAEKRAGAVALTAVRSTSAESAVGVPSASTAAESTSAKSAAGAPSANTAV
jgi:hypothetical protein